MRLTQGMGLKSPILATMGVFGISVIKVLFEDCRMGFPLKNCLTPKRMSFLISGHSFLKNSVVNPFGPGDLPI